MCRFYILIRKKKQKQKGKLLGSHCILALIYQCSLRYTFLQEVRSDQHGNQAYVNWWLSLLLYVWLSLSLSGTAVLPSMIVFTRLLLFLNSFRQVEHGMTFRSQKGRLVSTFDMKIGVAWFISVHPTQELVAALGATTPWALELHKPQQEDFDTPSQRFSHLPLPQP